MRSIISQGTYCSPRSKVHLLLLGHIFRLDNLQFPSLGFGMLFERLHQILVAFGCQPPSARLPRDIGDKWLEVCRWGSLDFAQSKSKLGIAIIGRRVDSTVTPQITIDDIFRRSRESKHLSPNRLPPPLVRLSQHHGFGDGSRCRTAMGTTEGSGTVCENSFRKVVSLWLAGRRRTGDICPVVLVKNGQRREGGPQDGGVESGLVSPVAESASERSGVILYPPCQLTRADEPSSSRSRQSSFSMRTKALA